VGVSHRHLGKAQQIRPSVEVGKHSENTTLEKGFLQQGNITERFAVVDGGNRERKSNGKNRNRRDTEKKEKKELKFAKGDSVRQGAKTLTED